MNITSFSSLITPIAQGIQEGALATGLHMGIQQAKNSDLPGAAIQTFLQTPVLKLVNKGLAAANRFPLVFSPSIGWVVFLTPALLFLSTKVLGEGKLCSAIQTLGTQIPNLYLVAITVSQIAIVYFTPGPQAIFSLLFAAATQLAQSGLLSERISTIGSTMLMRLGFASYVFLLPRTFTSFLQAGMLFGIDRFNTWIYQVEPPNLQGVLTKERIREILHTPANILENLYEINPMHISWFRLPPVPTLKQIHENKLLHTPLVLWDKINWNQCPNRQDHQKLRHYLELQIASLEGQLPKDLEGKPPKDRTIRRFLFIADELQKRNQEDLEKLLWDLAEKPMLHIQDAFTSLSRQSDSASFFRLVLQELHILRTDLINNNPTNAFQMLDHSNFQSQDSIDPSNISVNIFTKLTTRAEINKEFNHLSYTVSTMIYYIYQYAECTPSFKKELENWWTGRMQQKEEMIGIAATEEWSCAVSLKTKIIALLEDFQVIQVK